MTARVLGPPAAVVPSYSSVKPNMHDIRTVKRFLSSPAWARLHLPHRPRLRHPISLDRFFFFFLCTSLLREVFEPLDRLVCIPWLCPDTRHQACHTGYRRTGGPTPCRLTPIGTPGFCLPTLDMFLKRRAYLPCRSDFNLKNQ